MPENLQLEPGELLQVAKVIDQGILVCDRAGNIEYSNPFASSFFGFALNELSGKHFSILTEDPNVAKALLAGAKEITEVKGKNRFNKEIYYTAKITSSSNDKFVIIISDVTRRIEGRNKLLQKIETCEKLTKSRFIREGQLSDAIEEILVESARVLGVERVNAWLIDSNFSMIECIGACPSQNAKSGNMILQRRDMPAYFKLLETQEIISTDDTLHDPKTAELMDIYLSKYGITSMMDVPIRIEGEMIGVVCFEHTGTPRKWDLTERKFGLFIAQLISLALETHQRKETQGNLEKSYKEKELLLAEIHHRVKNNLAMVSSLLNLQQSKARDDFHGELFTESKNRILSIASIHQMLYQNKNFARVDFASYMNEIVSLLRQSYLHLAKKTEVMLQVDAVEMDLSKAIPLGLIANEIVSNSFKHAFDKDNENKIEIYLRSKKNKYMLEISDNGKGIKDLEAVRKKNTLGLSLVYDLADQVNATIEYSNKKGSHFILYFE
ncbi:MAG TPA: histidine kinase dimerization/phosphoacceptor domain -containing protein [Flavobacteriales bacterium]|nr:histidine kinase dimerization/phosphoacceptor domain -containing protein [Flavobacteriales bacterium]